MLQFARKTLVTRGQVTVTNFTTALHSRNVNPVLLSFNESQKRLKQRETFEQHSYVMRSQFVCEHDDCANPQKFIKKF